MVDDDGPALWSRAWWRGLGREMAWTMAKSLAMCAFMFMVMWWSGMLPCESWS